MLFAETSDNLVTAVFAGIGALVAVGVPAWIALRSAWQSNKVKDAELAALQAKSKVELDKQVRNGVLEEWREVTNMQSDRIDQQNARIEKCSKEVDRLHEQVSALGTENSLLRGLMAKKDERVEGQAAELGKLQTAVAVAQSEVVVAVGQLTEQLAAKTEASPPAKENGGQSGKKVERGLGHA